MDVVTDDCRKRELVDRVAKLHKPECIQVLKIIKKHDVRYTENANGTFVSLANINPAALDEMCEFVNRCFEIQQENDHRAKQIKEFEEEMEQYEQCNKPDLHENGRKDFDLLHAIKNNRNLNSLEKAVMKESLNVSLSEKVDSSRKKSLTPKYTGGKARLLKLCRSTNRNAAQTTGSNITRSDSSMPEPASEDVLDPANLANNDMIPKNTEDDESEEEADERAAVEQQVEAEDASDEEAVASFSDADDA